MKRIPIAALSAAVLVLAMAGSALAWVAPVLAAECAPDENTYAWTITLNPESNQNIDLSWDENFSVVFDTMDFGTSGPHSFTTDRGGDTLYVRYASDHNAKASAAANSELCEQPLEVSALVAPCEGLDDTTRIRFLGLIVGLHVLLDGGPVTPDGNGDVLVTPGLHTWSVEDDNGRTVASGQLTVVACPTSSSPGGSPAGSPEGGTAGGSGTPAASLADTATSTGSLGSPLATVGFGLILLGSLGALAYANIAGAVRRRS